MEGLQEVSLSIEGQVFKVKKDMLVEHSDYFRAMFSGNYIEKEQQEIRIDVVDATSMNIILRYMELGLIDLTEYSLSTVAQIASAANFLQITELTKQIDYCLEAQLSKSNWMEIREMAQNSPSLRLEQEATIYGLFSFSYMLPEHIQSLRKLFWYLSHPYLHTDSELHVFKFGLQWVERNEMGADTLLLILCCLDMNRLTSEDLKEMKDLVKGYVNSLAEKVIDCLYKLSTEFELSVTGIKANKLALCELFSEKVVNEALNLVKESIQRKLKLQLVIAMWTNSESDNSQYNMFNFTEESGFQHWVGIGENLWGWTITTWTPSKLVMVCGEYGRGTGVFHRDVRIYDINKKEWIRHGVELPIRRHAGVVVVDDSLFIVGGVGGFRVVLDTGIVYDLKRQTFRTIGKLPDPIQLPAICVHEKEVFVVANKHIYKYEDTGNHPRWVKAIDTDLRPTCLVSFKQYIYVAQNYFPSLYRFRPGIDETMQEIACFNNFPLAVCNLGDKILSITTDVVTELLTVEEFVTDNKEPHTKKNTKIIWSNADWQHGVLPAGLGSVVMTTPPTDNEISTFHQRYLTMYGTG